MKETKAIACPECNSTTHLRIERESTPDSPDSYMVVCQKCRSYIFGCSTETKAIKQWNTWAGGRQPVTPETGGTKGVGISDLLGANARATMKETILIPKIRKLLEELKAANQQRSQWIRKGRSMGITCNGSLRIRRSTYSKIHQCERIMEST